MIDFTLSNRQLQIKEGIHGLAASVIRPASLQWDRDKAVPLEFLRNLSQLATGMTGGIALDGDPEKLAADAPGKAGVKRKTSVNLTSIVAAEEMAWGDAGLLLNMPGPGLGGPPVRGSGTPEQKERFFGVFRDMASSELKWGAYALTEPGAGSDVAAIRTSCRKDGARGDWVLNGRKCYITNGARAAWNVVFATIDPALGRAGHRAFVVEKGTPGFSVGRIEDKMGLRASETAELVFEECRVPAENLLGGEAQYAPVSSDGGSANGKNAGFMTAMKTFDNTRPLVGSMAIGIGRAAYEYARDFVKSNYVFQRHTPRYAAVAERLARVGRNLDAARVVTWRAGWMADEEMPNAKEASMSKALAGQAAIRACIEAIEICGAEGTIARDHQLLEKWFRDIKVFDIFEGTGQIQRVVIAKRLFTDLKSF